jgi:hypothetical protein
MSNREILSKARKDVMAGRDRREVFAAYQAQVKKPHQLATVIASVAVPERMRSWQIPNWILVVLLGIAAASKAVVLYRSFSGGDVGLGLLIAGLGIIVPIACAIEVARFNGSIHGLLTLLCGLSLWQVLSNDRGDVTDTAVDVGLIAVVLVLSQLIRARVFPSLGFAGARRNAAGQFML